MGRAADGGRRWTEADVPDQAGRVAVVTGASAGIGLETATVLARRGATVVLACRDLAKGQRAASQIGAADVRLVRLDLASLSSVREAAGEIRDTFPRLNLLINNAGVMDVPLQRTPDGFELTLATNHLGPFAFTGLVLDRLLAASGSRVVTVSSVAHQRGVMDFGDLNAEHGYDSDRAYGQSKLANLLFTRELSARLGAHRDGGTTAVAAHPGVASTELWRTSSWLGRALVSRRLRVLSFWLVQSAKMGALPSLRAATDPSARSGDFYGPGGWSQYTGYPVLVEPVAAARDDTAARRLWEASERLTGVTYPLP
jgi:NAD(P)-dependent dehydrogenase (short-subunit alcohol dehydrogenase family)